MNIEKTVENNDKFHLLKCLYTATLYQYIKQKKESKFSLQFRQFPLRKLSAKRKTEDTSN